MAGMSRASTLAILLVPILACGGQTVGTAEGSASAASEPHASGSGGGGSSGSSTSLASEVTETSATTDFDDSAVSVPTPPDPGDAGACVDVDVASLDTSCTTAADCTAVAVGELCVPDDCSCNFAYISQSAVGQYQQMIESIPMTPNACACPAYGAAGCSPSGQCITCPLVTGPADGGWTKWPPGCPLPG
jgi:hypothetical protein